MKASQRELREQLGQLLIVGFEGTESSARLRTIMGGIQPGGVILFARNIESPAQTYALLEDCRRVVGMPMFTCVDMEGGTVDRFKKVLAPMPSAADVARSGKKALYRRHGELIGAECRALGFNTDFAPSFDLGLPPSQAALGSRTASADPRIVATYAREFMRGLASKKILNSAKHFPGLGWANLDTHKELPSIDRTLGDLWEADLFPYRKLKRDADFVMVAHAVFPQVSGPGRPASLSPEWITGILRKKIGYQGLVATDDLEMGAVLAAASIEDAVVQAVRAGADVLLICKQEEFIFRGYDSLLREAERDRRFAARVRESSRRIRRMKGRSKAIRERFAEPTERSLAKLRGQVEKFAAEIQERNAHQEERG